MRRRRTEQEDQRAVVDHLRARGAHGIVFWHHPAGGARSKTEAAIMKGLGAKAGLPDLFLLCEGQLYGLELKRGKGGLSKVQGQALTELELAGAIVGIAFGLDEALEWLTKHDLLLGTVQ